MFFLCKQIEPIFKDILGNGLELGCKMTQEINDGH